MTLGAAITEFDKAAADEMLTSVFARWIQDLDLSVERLDTNGAVLRMPFSEKLCRDNGVVCGQALMSLADTAMVFAVSSAAGAYKPMTTVDQTMHFLRPAANADVLAEARVVRLGRTMAFGSVTLTTDGDERPIAMAQLAYAMLPESK
ncbi:MAG TPA: PaaI family thioesterase [Microvirga sp.]|nr:PaaI family thioesterase [Microvirga sp.]